jgi:nucleoside-diphosphate-sugar epimerase
LQVVRPGGIYGYERGIDVRLKSGKPIPVSNTPVHRIHVKDLATIICHLVDNQDAPNYVNAVDLEARPSWEVASWLVENRDDLTEEMLPDAANCIPGTPQRIISNQRLLELGITLRYPTFREGMVG